MITPDIFDEVLLQAYRTNGWWYAGMPMAPPTPLAARKRTRKVPANMWHWSAAEPTLRRRILSLPYLGQDEIDPDKPYLVSEEAGTVSIVQEDAT